MNPLDVAIAVALLAATLGGYQLGFAARLLACESADEGAELLAALRPKAADLKRLAKALNIPPGRNMADTTEKILKLTLGGRTKHAVLRQG